MSKKIDILTLGDLCVDLIINGTDIEPEFGQKEKLVQDYSLEMGGSCSIFASQCGKLGLNTLLIGRVGDDQFGQQICHTLSQANVDISHINIDKKTKTGITVALNKGYDRAMLTFNGTIDVIEPQDIPDEILNNVRHFHIGSYYLMKKIQPHYPTILKKLKQYGATISMDTNWDPEEKWDGGILDIMKYIDIFFPNENEAMSISRESTPEKAIEKLKKYIPIIAVKKGKDGAVVYSSNNIYQVPAIDVIKLDAVGAGDSFDAGFLYGYLNGMSIEDCARWGCICGSLNTRATGGTKGQPYLDEVQKYFYLYEKNK